MRNQSPYNRLGRTLATALGPILWGSSFVLVGKTLTETGPLSMATLRALPAGLLLLMATRSWRSVMPWHRMMILATLNIACFQSLLFLSAQKLPGGITALIGSLQPLLILILIWWQDHKRPHPLALIATMIGLTGIWMVSIGKTSHYDAFGLLAGFAASISMGFGTYLSVKWRGKTDPVTLIAWQLLSGGLLLLGPAILLEKQDAEWSWLEISVAGYLVFFGTAAAYALWFRGLAMLPPVAVTSLGLLSPLTALLVSWLFLGESLLPLQLIGVAAVIASIAILQKTNSGFPMHSKEPQP